MVTLSATYLADLGRVRLTAGALVANVSYTLQRSLNNTTWTEVRGGGNVSTTGVTVVDDYEYTPNVINYYRLIAPAFYDSFNRVYPTGGALEVSGTAASRADTPDAASLDITGDIDIRAVIDFPDYSDGNQTLVAKYLGSGNQRSYALRIGSTGNLAMLYSLNGSTGLTATATASVYSVGVNDGIPVAVRVTRVSATGVITFYVSDELSPNPVTWTQVGTTVAGTSGALFSGTALLEVGTLNSGTSDMSTGDFLFAQVRNGIAGTVVANPDFTAQAPGTLSFVDSTGKTWTMRGDSAIVSYGPLHGTTWGTADTGQVYTNTETDPNAFAYVDNGVGVIGDPDPVTDIIEMTAPTDPAAFDAEFTWSAIQPDPSLDVPALYAVGLRGTDASNYYEGRILFYNASAGRIVSVQLGKFVAGVNTNLTVELTVGTWSAGIPWYGKFRIVGSSLVIKAWAFGTDEPNDWQQFASDSSLTLNSGMHIRTRKDGGVSYVQQYGPLEIRAIPDLVAATASITPVQSEVFLKSVAYPLFNTDLECVDWDALSRDSRAGFYDIKGRHEILAITDVGSSGTFSLTFVSRSEAENASILGLLTYGGVLLLQPPGETEEECAIDYSGIPSGYVVPSGSVQPHSLRGQPIWVWEVQFTQVAAMDANGILPTTITWLMLWAIIGEGGTWEDVWALWSTWQEVWLTQGSIEDFA